MHRKCRWANEESCGDCTCPSGHGESSRRRHQQIARCREEQQRLSPYRRFSNYDRYAATYFSLDEHIRKEYEAINKYWSNRIDIIGKIGQWYNDLFLKLNGNINGTDDYIDEGEKEDTGTTDDNDRPIYEITQYSPYQKVFINEYIRKTKIKN